MRKIAQPQRAACHIELCHVWSDIRNSSVHLKRRRSPSQTVNRSYSGRHCTRPYLGSQIITHDTALLITLFCGYRWSTRH